MQNPNNMDNYNPSIQLQDNQQYQELDSNNNLQNEQLGSLQDKVQSDGQSSGGQQMNLPRISAPGFDQQFLQSQGAVYKVPSASADQDMKEVSLPGINQIQQLQDQHQHHSLDNDRLAKIDQMKGENQAENSMQLGEEKKQDDQLDDALKYASQTSKNSQQNLNKIVPSNTLKTLPGSVGELTQGVQGSIGSNSNPTNNYQIPPNIIKMFLEAIKKGDMEFVKMEQEKQRINLGAVIDENFRHNGIFYATLIKDENLCFKMVDYLVQQGVDPAISDSLSQTPLFYASREGKAILIDMLVKSGCDPNQLDTYGQTPIFYASREGHLDVLRKLIEHGAECDPVDQNGQTPLYYAVRGGKIESVEFLIKNGADVNHEDKKNQTPMHIAKRSNRQAIVALLTQNGAKGLEDLRKQQNKMKDRKMGSNTLADDNLRKGLSGIPEKNQPKRYVLTVLRENGQYEQLTEEELNQFEQQFPELAKFWMDQQSLEQLQLPKIAENAPFYESWDKAAKRLLNTLWKMNQAWIFHEAVDPEKLGIPDYFKVITHPMDFGTIKNRLNSNKYEHLEQFLADMSLVFENCLKFNGEDSSVGRMCKQVKEEYRRIYEQLNIEFYLN